MGRRRPAGGNGVIPPLYAHRFGRSYGPDSVASTLATALAGGVDGLETDCCLTADGRLALLHSPYLPAGTTADGWAHERTAAEIVAAHAKDRRGKVVEEHPLLLEDLWPLVAGHDLVVQLEVKAVADEALAVRTAQALCASLAATSPPAGTTVEVISFWPEALPVAAAEGWRTRAIVATAYTPEAFARWAVDHGTTGVILEAPFWGGGHVETWQAAGLSVMSGVCNDPDLARMILPFGPDAIATDRPHELRAALAS